MKSMMLVAVAAVLTVASGCDIGTPGSGIAATQNRSVDDFHAVSVSGTADAKVTVGSEKSVIVTLDDNLIDMVRTEVSNGELKIWVDGNYSTSIGLDIQVTTPSLDAVSVSGVGDLVVTNVDSPSMTVNVSGVGEAKVSGTVEKLDVSVSGTGDAELKDLKSKTATVSTSGVGGATVFVTESVEASASGTSDIVIHGNPADVKQSASGVADVIIAE